MKKIVIVGGGFGGVRAALDLSRERIDAEITLFSDRPNFEYTPKLYRVAVGEHAEEDSIPLDEIFAGSNVRVVVDAVRDVNLEHRLVRGTHGNSYEFDFCILALGAETNYFNIPGLAESAFGFKTVSEATKLNAHLHKVFASCAEVKTHEEKMCAAHIVVVGGGATGVEVAAELCGYAKKLAKRYGVDESMVKIDLVEALPRILPLLPEGVSMKVANRLTKLGVNLMLGRTLMKKDAERVFMDEGELTTKTLVWATGAKPDHLYAEIQGLQHEKGGRIGVDAYLQARGQENVFVIGDGASTAFTGWAQTADGDGAFVARVIAAKMRGSSMPKYAPKNPASVVPVGKGWAAALFGPFKLYGRLGWLVRRMADLRYFASILPLSRALRLF